MTRPRLSLLPAILIALGLIVTAAVPGSARQSMDSSHTDRSGDPAGLQSPAYCLAIHDIGRIGFTMSNWGRFGTGALSPLVDCVTEERAPDAEYPIGSGTNYLYIGGLWIGGVRDGDTLVSTAVDRFNFAREFNPEPSPFGDITRRTRIFDPTEPEPDDIVSEQDFVARYSDTLTFGNPYPSFDEVDGRPHEPLGVEVTQRSYMWSFGYADDFIIMEFEVRNVGDDVLKDVFFGFYMDHDISTFRFSTGPQIGDQDAKPTEGGDDDVTGFIHSYPREREGCGWEDTLLMAWAADADGDVIGNGFEVPNVTGLRWLQEPKNGEFLSYNWYVQSFYPNLDFGPQKRENFRRFASGGLGSPLGDKERYFLMSNGEIDYDQPFHFGLDQLDPEWIYMENRRQAIFLSQGDDIQYILSVGPKLLPPGASFTVPVAFVGGEGFHTYSRNLMWNIRNAYRPERYYSFLDFDEFVQNAVWASWVYDNPGVDTDGDGYFGKSQICVYDSVLENGEWIATVADTVFYEGDGEPDLRAASPPPPPKVWVEPALMGLRVRWNGQDSENSEDIFSGLNDFEGYKVYMARDSRETSFSLVSTYDRENYDKFVYNPNLQPEPDFQLRDRPYTLEELRCLYGRGSDPCNDSLWDPLWYTPMSPYVHPDFPDSAFYFKPHEFNVHEFGQSTGIRKVYPNAREPIPPLTDDDFTEDGLLKYYEYEYIIDELLPTVPYYVSVTAFDFGSPAEGLAPLETSRTLTAVEAYPAGTSDQLGDELPDVYIYPNPYRIDDDYIGKGYEGRNPRFFIPDRLRRIHFVNLPLRCTVRIFSLDGDLIREFEHDKSASDPTAHHNEWNLISRNTQMIVSGIYYWSVEDHETGRVQTGKLVVIL
ncbi:hypothetical protein GF420_08790 [candidate division GN15 bacterium]|nr:hypothetical protein [candidate division GN15 bacterium]